MFYSAFGGDFENIYLPVSLQNYGIFITCRFFFAIYLLALPEKKYRLPCWKLICIAEICSVALAMGLGFVFPYQMECLGILASWTVQLIGYFHLWSGFFSIWECYAIVPMQLLAYALASNMIKTNHPFLFSAMAFGGWAFVSINVGLTYSELLQEPKVAKSEEALTNAAANMPNLIRSPCLPMDKEDENKGPPESSNSTSPREGIPSGAAKQSSNSVSVMKMQRMFKKAAEDNIRDIKAYVTELNECVAQLQYQNQLLDKQLRACQVQGLEANDGADFVADKYWSNGEMGKQTRKEIVESNKSSDECSSSECGGAKDDLGLVLKEMEAISAKAKEEVQLSQLETAKANAALLNDKLEASEKEKEMFETSLKKLQIQAEQWRKAADAAAALVSGDTEIEGRWMAMPERRRPLLSGDEVRRVVSERYSNSVLQRGVDESGNSEATEWLFDGDWEGVSQSARKKKGSGIKMFGDLWKRKIQKTVKSGSCLPCE
ncbi:unnamed protein product [Cuscuta campestris]|uniref:Uncharacterized protein n=1 Tax=Cuscuta campestris TaxID=132261 RepID=A0A484L8U7_9ASTE|nr:unnamed protein product [Cuscuta campestris]